MCRTFFTTQKPGTVGMSEEPGERLDFFLEMPARVLLEDSVYLGQLLPKEITGRAEYAWLLNTCGKVEYTSWHGDAEGIFLAVGLSMT